MGEKNKANHSHALGRENKWGSYGEAKKADSEREISKLSKKRKKEKLFKKAKLIDETARIPSNKYVNFAEISSKNLLSVKIDPQKLAEIYFDWLIEPLNRETFFSDYWEKKHLLVQRNDAQFFQGLFSTEEWEKILDTQNIEFGVNLDVVKYENGQRTTLNPEGRAVRSVVWDFYEAKWRFGSSIKPAILFDVGLAFYVHFTTTFRHFCRCECQFCEFKLKKTAILKYFSDFFYNSLKNYTTRQKIMLEYLTPPNSQGFAPHFDDIEAFILQLEGRKRWMLYKNKNEEEILARFSSHQKSKMIDGSNFWKWDPKNQRMITIDKNPLNSNSKIRLIDRYCIRILREKQDNDESLVVYYNVENSRIYRKKEIQKFDITNQERQPLEFLMAKYPNLVKISDLPMENEDEK
uniref:Bifunctional lysine-specific demethylase and histidyl-hydroxylase n=1 Tax=Romanomermis culicivorax TaxID=13658 RepID=A0A915HYF7_ROMCU